MKTAIFSERAPRAIGPYSQAVKAGDWVFVSGQLPLDVAGAAMPASVAEQTEQCLHNAAAILGKVGLELKDVVKTTVFMTDLDQFAAMNEVYAKHFAAPFPARATVQVAALPKGASVEIEAVAFGKK
ncbi:MAG: reactive intermediate/imine deaminase [Elusimicrobia bacterium]|nr:reactive intermediate/imine deaminase [Elusimicrobiota bacterium]